ncbi:MAG: AAA family ATPase [Promethearchaeota archaeon]
MVNQKPFIESVHLTNFLLYEDIEIPLKEGISILTGRNGSGKSLFLDALRLGLGLSSRTIRMDKIGQYLRDPEKSADITLTINNPKVDDERLLRSSNPKMNNLFFSESQVIIRRTIQAKGRGTDYYLRDAKNKYQKLDSDQKKALTEALFNIGINPHDELAFVPAEDFLNFMGKNGRERYLIFKEKIGLLEPEKRYKSVNEKIFNLKGKFQEMSSESSSLDSQLIEDELNHREWEKKQELFKEKEKWIEKLDWSHFKRIKKSFEISNKDLGRLKDEYARKSKELGEKSKIERNAEEERNKADEVYDNKANILKDINKKKNVADGALSAMTKSLSSNKQDLGRLKGEISALERNIKDLKKQIEDLRSGNTDFQAAVRELKERAADIKNEIEQLNNDSINAEKKIRDRKRNLFKEIDDEIKNIEIQIKNLKEGINKKVEDVKTKDRGGRSSRKDSTRYIQFINELKKNGIKKSEYLGPLFQEISPQPGDEKWIDAISAKLGFKTLNGFLALKENVYRKMDEITKNNPIFKGIGVGSFFIDTVNQSLYEEQVDYHKISKLKEKNPKIYDNISGLIKGNKHALAYLRKYNGIDRILMLDTSDRTIARKIAENMMNDGFGFFTVNCIPIEVRAQGTTRISSISRIPDFKIGDSLDGGEFKEDGVNLLRQQVKQLENKIHNLYTKKSNIEIDDKKIKEQRHQIKEINQDIGRLKGDLAKVEKEINQKDPVALSKGLQRKIDDNNLKITKKKSLIKKITNDIEKIERDVKEKEDTTEKLKIDIKTAKTNKDKANKILDEKNSALKEIQIELKELTRELKIIEKDISSKEKKEEELKAKYEELYSRFKGKKEPKDLETEPRIEGYIQRIDEELEKYSKITDELEEKYQERIKLKEEYQEKREEIKKDLRDLEKEAAKWADKISETLDQKLDAINDAFNQILSVINASGSIVIENREDPNNMTLGIFVQFFGEDIRSLELHSSGQKQAAIISLVIAMQTQTVSPITAIDEFDKGLDPLNKRSIIEVIPEMIGKLMKTRVVDYLGEISPQYIIILPELVGKSLPDDINYLTCVRSKNLAEIKNSTR